MRATEDVGIATLLPNKDYITNHFLVSSVSSNNFPENIALLKDRPEFSHAALDQAHFTKSGPRSDCIF